MPLTATINTSIQLSTAYSAISGTATVSDGQVTQFNNTITNNNVAETLAIALPTATLKAAYVVSDTNVVLTFTNVTALTNLAMLAGVPFCWSNNAYIASPFDNNVTSIVIRNNNQTTNAIVQGVFVLDPTA